MARTQAQRNEENAYNLKILARGIVQVSIRTCRTHAATNAEIAERIYEAPAFARLTQRQRHAIRQYIGGLLDGVYEHLHWRVLLDGQLIRSEDVPHNRWGDVVSGGGRFCWNSQPHKQW